MRRDTRLTDEDIEGIFKGFQAHRLHEVYDNQTLKGMHEFLVEIFRSHEWTNSKLFETRNGFISHVKSLDAHPDDHRRMFRAMAESGNAHAVIAYLHMIGHKNRVFLSDRSALLSTDELTLMVKDSGQKIGSVIHFLSRAVAPGSADSLAQLPKEIVKAMGNQPDFKYRERFLEGLQSLVMRYGLKKLGLGKSNHDNGRWIEAFYSTHDHRHLALSSSILAAQVFNKNLSPQRLLEESTCFSDRMRLIKNLGFNFNDFGAVGLVSSHNPKKPSFRLESQLQL